MGANAVDLLITLIERNETGLPEHPITQMTPSLWNPGETLRRSESAPRGAATARTRL